MCEDLDDLEEDDDDDDDEEDEFERIEDFLLCCFVDMVLDMTMLVLCCSL